MPRMLQHRFARWLRFILVAAFLWTLPAGAATFVIVNNDGAGVGLNDPTPVQPVGGNVGTTLGAQRRIVFEEAGRILGQYLVSAVPIRVSVQFQQLGAGGFFVTLAFASAEDYEANFPNAPRANTLYPVALANSIAGTDLQPSRNDISVVANASIDISGGGFYYGLDSNAPRSQTDLLDVAIHEICHGLGFATPTSSSTGAFLNGQPDIYAVFLKNTLTGRTYPEMSSNLERAEAATAGPNLVWSGPSTTAAHPAILSPNPVALEVTAPPGVAGAYTVGLADYGPSVPGNGISGELVLVDDGNAPSADACSAILNTDEVDGKIALIDRGTCFFDDKTFRAQVAGAVAVVIVNNVDTGPIPMAGDEIVNGFVQDFVIPTVSVSRTDGDLLKAAGSGVQVMIGPGPATFAAVTGEALQVYAPDPVEGGSSVSHWADNAEPDLLMEPSISPVLRDDLDLTLTLFRDIGWTVVDIPYPHLTYALWQEQELPGEPASGPADNPDGDALINYEEYVFGGNPLRPDGNVLPVIRSNADPKAFTYTRSTAFTDANIIYEVSGNLRDWTTAEVGVDISTEFIDPMGTQAERVTVNVLTSQPRTFIRLRMDSE